MNITLKNITLKKKILAICVGILVLSVLLIVGIRMKYIKSGIGQQNLITSETPNNKVDEAIKSGDPIKKDVAVEYKTDINKARDHYINLIHKMANTKIIAEDNQVWGMVDINNENIDKCIAYLEIDVSVKKLDRDILIAGLKEWKEGNFNSSVAVHNQVWSYLGGTVGKAKSVRN
ncbi:hypothetical protein CPJCM30710_27940 [Clostridium polyendosporum]|uniref:Uncharacterized protein n=1 Tax=Clostridium polyendosporum TaxID=69208 RepID=A0A919S3V8_9CLOT|nr:DUF6241 domain-containing protein [Clostridium polyendosporum]GIM30128.1 hypothetical protein CPJCM30710_27940 [Clostridium polyendosporum]